MNSNGKNLTPALRSMLHLMAHLPWKIPLNLSSSASFLPIIASISCKCSAIFFFGGGGVLQFFSTQIRSVRSLMNHESCRDHSNRKIVVSFPDSKLGRQVGVHGGRCLASTAGISSHVESVTVHLRIDFAPFKSVWSQFPMARIMLPCTEKKSVQ